MGQTSRIDIVVPGLFGPVALAPGNLPALPALSILLGRSYCRPAPGADPVAALFDLFGFRWPKDVDLPSAPFCRLAQAPDSKPGGYWLHADPIHLQPDRDRLVLFDARHLDLEAAEAGSLATLFNEHFSADGLLLEATRPAHWYLHVDPPPRLCTKPLARVVGRQLEPSHLDGPDAASWMRRLNETQMLFFHSEVNQGRERKGLPTISGIWPWGGGVLPAKIPACPYDDVVADETLAHGLARAAGMQPRSLADALNGTLDTQRGKQTLVFWHGLWSAVSGADAPLWLRELTRFAAWLEELLGLLKRGQIAELLVYPCNGTCLALTGRAMRRFWRRPVGIESRLLGIAQ